MDKNRFNRSRLLSGEATDMPVRAPCEISYDISAPEAGLYPEMATSTVHMSLTGILNCSDVVLPEYFERKGRAVSYEFDEGVGQCSTSGVSDAGLYDQDYTASTESASCYSRGIVEQEAFENAATVTAAPEAMVKPEAFLFKVAHEIGIKFELFDVAETFEQNSYKDELSANKKACAAEVFERHDAPVLLKALPENRYPELVCFDVTGKSLAENLENVTFDTNEDVIYPVSKPITYSGRVADYLDLQICRARPADRFHCKEDENSSVGKCEYEDDEVILIRGKEQSEGSCVRKMLSTTAALYGQGDGENVVLATGGRFPYGTREDGMRHAGSDMTIGGSDVVAGDDDIVSGSVVESILELKNSLEELQRRNAVRSAPVHDYQTDTLRKYANQVEPARTGAVTHPGGREEVVCYADI